MHDIFQREIVFWGYLSSDYIKLDIAQYSVRTNENLHILCILEIVQDHAIRVAITDPIEREHYMVNSKGL